MEFMYWVTEIKLFIIHLEFLLQEICFSFMILENKLIVVLLEYFDRLSFHYLLHHGLSSWQIYVVLLQQGGEHSRSPNRLHMFATKLSSSHLWKHAMKILESHTVQFSSNVGQARMLCEASQPAGLCFDVEILRIL